MYQSLPRRVSKPNEDNPTRHACRLALQASKVHRTPKKQKHPNFQVSIKSYTPTKYYSDSESNLNHLIISSPVVKVKINNKTNKRLRASQQRLSLQPNSPSFSPITCLGTSSPFSPPKVNTIVNKNHIRRSDDDDLRKRIFLNIKNKGRDSKMENIDPSTPKVVTARQKIKFEKGKIENGKIIQFKSNSSLVKIKSLLNLQKNTKSDLEVPKKTRQHFKILYKKIFKILIFK